MKRNQTSSQRETHPRVGSERFDGPQGNSCVQVKTTDSPFQSHLLEPPRFSNAAAAAAAAKSLQLCPTLCDPRDGSPPGSHHPWDSPGKNIGVGCHFLLQCMKVKSESEVAQSCLTPSDPLDCSLPGSSVHGNLPRKGTIVGCHCLLRFKC